jgi:sec-independent protein translocase protein TatB
MFNVGGGELLMIMLVALIVLGPQRLPEAARTVGRVVSEVRRVSTGFQREIRTAFDESDATPGSRPARTAPTLAAAVDDVDDADGSGDGSGDSASADRALPAADGADEADTIGTARPAVVAGDDVAPEVAQALDQIAAPASATDPDSAPTPTLPDDVPPAAGGTAPPPGPAEGSDDAGDGRRAAS